jgi:F0F1-type ATP synthase assembly protein I
MENNHRQIEKAQSQLRRLAAFKIATILVGGCWVGLIGYLVYYSLIWSKVFFAVSALIHMMVSIIAIAVYVKQLVFIKRIHNSRTIIETKMNLVKLQSSTIWITRLLFLQMPVFVTFYLSPEVFRTNNLSFLIIQGLVIAFFTWLGIWLYRNIGYKNVNKRWFNVLFNTPEWTNVINAMHLVREMDDFKKEGQLSY